MLWFYITRNAYRKYRGWGFRPIKSFRLALRDLEAHLRNEL